MWQVATGTWHGRKGPLGHQEVQIWPPSLIGLPGPVTWLWLFGAP